MATDPEFVTYYLNEINSLRVAGGEFARTYPHLAGGLDFHGGGESEDPQVSRLIESFAFLTAKLQQQYDAQFPEVPTALLEALYPQLVAPVPSMAIAKFTVSPKQQRAVEGVVVPRKTAVFATTDHVDCRFQTGATLQLWPIDVSAVVLKAANELSMLDARTDVQSCLRVTLKCTAENRTFADLNPATLRFFLDGDRNARYRLYELLTNNLIEVRTVPAGKDDARLAPARPGLKLRQIGLDPQEAMLPYPEAAHHGYRLLQEYFNFPDKFLFLELFGIETGMFGDGRTIDLLFYLDIEPEERLLLDSASLRLGCVPIVNLFPQTSEPIRLDHLSLDYTLAPDLRAADVTEVHSVLGISRSARFERSDLIAPYFSPEPDPEPVPPPNQADKNIGGPLRWIARRRPVSNPALTGTEMQLSFVDPQMDPMQPAEDVLFAQMLCTNRALPRQISTATRLDIETDLPIERIRCLAKPTMPVDPPLAGENLWRLVSHLSLNKWSLDGPNRLEALRQILFLYSGSDENSRKRRQIEALHSIETSPILRRLGNRHWRGFVRGTEIIVSFEADQFVGASALLLGSVLDRFFALYAGVNSFTELAVRRAHHKEDWKRWPPRAGNKPIL